MRSVTWNYLGYFCEFVAGVFLLAFVVRKLPVDDYGIYLLAQSLAAFLYLLDFGLSNVLVPLYVSTFARGGIAEVSKLASCLVMTLLGMGIAGATGLSLAAMLMPELIRLPTARMALAVQVLIVVSAAVCLMLPQMALEHLCQAFHRFDRVNQVQIAAVAMRVVLTLVVLDAGKGILALAGVQVAVSLSRLAGLWLVASTGISGLSLRLFSFDTDRLREAIGLSRWAFVDDVSRRIGMNTETVVLAALGSLNQVAMFGIGGKLPAHLYQFAVRGLSVLVPTLTQHHAEGDTAQLRSTFCNAYRVCLTGVVPLATFGSIGARPLIAIWAGPAYLGAAPVLSWLMISALSMVILTPSDMVLYSHNRIGQAAWFSCIETLGKILVVLALAARYGAVGAAAGVAVWNWCVNLFCYLPAACKVAEMRPWELWRAALMGSSGASGQQAQSERTSNLLQGGAYVACAVVLAVGVRHLAALEMFAACVGVSLLYFAVWVGCTALPMWRRASAEAPAVL
ncbi:oligosaccharide flippase family protein [Telmatobacter sp. DSM 110680]|uniref:Oligosaccharide flippase family protein n=1 Tax=Telmatobacter sp. DSM 110680 TaxID=3036704 RepID=A0AAU7DEG1_9BACT